MIWRFISPESAVRLVVDHRPVEKFPDTAPKPARLSPGRDAFIASAHRYGEFIGVPGVCGNQYSPRTVPACRRDL
jgi:hypothetical protein